MPVLIGLLLVVAFDFLLEYIWNRMEVNEEFWVSKFLNFAFKYRIITIVAFVFASTFRASTVGLDTQNYLHYYNELANGTRKVFVAPIATKFEIWFTFINSILAAFNLDFKMLLFVVSLFVAICIVLFVNKFSNNKWLSLMLYVMLGVFAQSLNTLRQILAIALMLLALVKLFDKRWFASIVLILFASTFHITALVCLVLVPLRYIKFKSWHVIGIIILTAGASFAFPTILKIVEQLTPLDFYTKYMVEITEYIGASSMMDNLYSVALIAMYAAFFIAQKKFKEYDKQEDDKYNMFLNLYLVVPLIRVAGFITKMQALFNRISMYFFISLIILIPMFVERVAGKNKKLYSILLALVVCVGLAFMYFLHVMKGSCGIVPFTWDF